MVLISPALGDLLVGIIGVTNMETERQHRNVVYRS